MKHTDKVPSASRLESGAAEPAAETAGGVNEGHESALNNPETIIEYLSVTDFIRRVPHQFHMDEVARFGRHVGMVADGVHCSYKSRIDRMLGEMRVFPANLLRRVYEVVGAEKKWPVIVDVEQPALEESTARARACLRSNEQAADVLQRLIDEAESATVIEALAVVRKWISAQTESLRHQIEHAEAPAQAA